MDHINVILSRSKAKAKNLVFRIHRAQLMKNEILRISAGSLGNRQAFSG